MHLRLLFRALAILALIILAEIANGTMRQLVVMPLVGDHTARQIGTLTGCLLILLIALATSPWLAAVTLRSQFAVGALWLVLMLAFEVAFGRMVAGASWEQLAADYRLLDGGLLGLGMGWLACAPWLAATIRSNKSLPP